MNEYFDIPTMEDCENLVNTHQCFSRSQQDAGGEQTLVSFKYMFSDLAIFEERFGINMRGITFLDGKLVALPFPKFCNFMENGTKYAQADLNLVKFAYNKADGSLISVFLLNDELEVKTMKSMYSDVANEARILFNNRQDVKDFSSDLLEDGLSPMFEYVGPDNRLVLSYDSEDFIFLGARSLTTGEIFYPHDLNVPANITTPKLFDNMDDINAHLEKSGIEGVVLTMENGHMVKMKTEEYFDLHRLMTCVSTKNILKNIYDIHEQCVDDKTDDIIGKLREKGVDELADMVLELRNEYFEKVKEYCEWATGVITERKGASRKELAQFVFGELKDRKLGGVLMATLDGKINAIHRLVYDELLEKGKKYDRV